MFRKLALKFYDFLSSMKPLPKGFEMPKIEGFLNPLCEIEVLYKGKQVFKQPFHFMLHTYLKDYGFDPETQLKNGDIPMVIFRMSQGSELRFPLYVKDRPEEGFKGALTPEDVIKRGYIIPQPKQGGR